MNGNSEAEKKENSDDGNIENGQFVFGLPNSTTLPISDLQDGGIFPLSWENDFVAPKALRVAVEEDDVFISIDYEGTGFGFGIESEFLFDPTSEDVWIQVGTHDFNKDGIEELVIAWRSEGMFLKILVYQYFPPVQLEASIRSQNWERIAVFEGQEYAYIDGAEIELPIGSQGLFIEYIWAKDRFVQTSPEENRNAFGEF